MKPSRLRTCSRLRLICGVLIFSSQYALSQQSIFSGLEYDTAQIQQAVARHTMRIETTAGAPDIPSSVSYRIFVQELLADSSLTLPTQDASILQDLAAASTQELAGEHHSTLSELCMQAAHTGDSTEEIVELATRFDASRAQSERTLDVRFAEALDRLTPAIAQEVEARWEAFSQRRTIVYSSFDMTGFAREMPDAAHRMLLAGCTRFQNMTRER